MRVLVIGAGAREHALCWKLDRNRASTPSSARRATPASPARCRVCPLTRPDPPRSWPWSTREAIDLTVVGPEAAADRAASSIALTAAGHRVCGPTRGAAAIESSKAFAKGLMAATAFPPRAMSRARARPRPSTAPKAERSASPWSSRPTGSPPARAWSSAEDAGTAEAAVARHDGGPALRRRRRRAGRRGVPPGPGGVVLRR